jgi:flavin reductase (DIM6/NTAB) family NADH-FMN oxidoreductase RutF
MHLVGELFSALSDGIQNLLFIAGTKPFLWRRVHLAVSALVPGAAIGDWQDQRLRFTGRPKDRIDIVDWKILIHFDVLSVVPHGAIIARGCTTVVCFAADLGNDLMQIDPALNSALDNYKLLTNLVLPRPIAWVTSLSPGGGVNLAPFSFFNAVGSDPLYVVISVGRHNSGERKDTAKNIDACGEFVVNMVTEDLFDAMNISAADFPPDQSELKAAGLHTAPSIQIKTPRVAQAMVSLECMLFNTQSLGENTMYIGQVVMFHVADHLMGSGLRVENFAPIGRLGSPSAYCRTTDRFDISRISYEQWLNDNKLADA